MIIEYYPFKGSHRMVNRSEELKAVTSIQHYTVGMAVMFMLYVATYSKDEIRTNIFSRLCVMGVSPFNMLGDKLRLNSLLCLISSRIKTIPNTVYLNPTPYCITMDIKPIPARS
ncbi:hypothetical protein N780_11550 [Pontibacillus chungwhensis BH030062]|uniref:Uncharacterized protein n=1 Tax=Pontibacillus chungwhensis BH030062 TaxID=1385513 RepID=A0A0A2UYD3_9BACI|nr:hypothetical protein N780_11550 [Pontibacillus chungwhensis BH030062]